MYYSYTRFDLVLFFQDPVSFFHLQEEYKVKKMVIIAVPIYNFIKLYFCTQKARYDISKQGKQKTDLESLVINCNKHETQPSAPSGN